MYQPDITVEELAEKRRNKENFTLIDVREPGEYAVGNLGGTLIPLGQIESRANEIPREGEVVVHCKLGGRSARAVEYLRSLGYTNVRNLTGGISAWSQRIDPSVRVG